MSIKTVTEFFFSPSGTSKAVANRIASKLGSNKRIYDLLRYNKGELSEFTSGDCLVVCVPVFAGRIPSICVDALNGLKGSGTPAIAVVVYGNRAYEDALLELRNILDSKGCVVIAAAAFIGQHSIFPSVGAGRPDKNDFDKMDDFSEKCASLLETFSTSQTKSVTVSGNFPYREPGVIPLKPSGNSKCNNCGACVTICPTHAINISNPKVTDKKICISCTACINACKQNSRKFHGILYWFVSRKFTKKFTMRNEPEIFI